MSDTHLRGEVNAAIAGARAMTESRSQEALRQLREALEQVLCEDCRRRLRRMEEQRARF